MSAYTYIPGFMPRLLSQIPADKRKAGRLHCNYKHFNAINTHLRRAAKGGEEKRRTISFAWLFCNPKLPNPKKKSTTATK